MSLCERAIGFRAFRARRIPEAKTSGGKKVLKKPKNPKTLKLRGAALKVRVIHESSS